MSVGDITFQFQDRRDEDPKRVVITLTGVPDNITRQEVTWIASKIKDKMMKAVQTQKSLIPIQTLRDALTNGDIDQATFDLLTQ